MVEEIDRREAPHRPRADEKMSCSERGRSGGKGGGAAGFAERSGRPERSGGAVWREGRSGAVASSWGRRQFELAVTELSLIRFSDFMSRNLSADLNKSGDGLSARRET